ncbi:lectin-like domain-containing protein [Enterococcus mundtii]|uniref:lectin-like domain-containing protein n=1 Tax=Enterococcus mundtii TaxID=53346 RepID=UPI0038FC65A3
MGIRNGIQTNTRPFFITFIIIVVFFIGGVCSSVFADVNQRQSTNVLVDNGEVALSLEDTNKGVRFKLEKNSSEALQFSVNLIDSKGEKIPRMIDDQSITENQVLTEEQFSTLHFTKPTEPVRLFVKYKSANGTLTDLTPPEGEILPLVEPENNDQSGTSGSQPTEVTSGTIEENSETGENQETTETQQATSEAKVAEEQSSTSSDYQPPQARAIQAFATGTGSQYVSPGAIPISGAFAAPNGGAVVSNVTNTNDNGGKPFSQISLSGSNNWTSIWSNDAYRLDFTKSFSQRVYVNFGTQQADGVAFVMHNDARKTTAITNSRAVGVDGQNLGIYGATGGYYELLAQRTPETTAIRNSFAVEFDLFANEAVTGRARYDAQIPAGSTPHMAYTFPGNLSRTYQPINAVNGDLGANEWFTLTLANPGRIKHNSLIPLNGAVSTNVQDGTWYEFNYSFNSNTRNFTYSFRNPVNGAKTADTTIPWGI